LNYSNIRKLNTKLAESENLSDHNKQLLERYFREALSSGSPKRTTLRDYASRWRKLGEVIDFKLDEATRDDLLNVMSDINTDEIKKRNGEDYSDHTKKKFLKTIQTFYNNFIDFKGRGHKPDVDGSVLVRGLSVQDEPAKQIRKEYKPTPSEVKQVIDAAKSLQEKCVIAFTWGTGCRVGEVFVTDDKSSYLQWEDITFRQDDLMSIRLGKSFKPSDPRRRTVLTAVTKPLIRKLYEERNPDPEDAVFYRRNNVLLCPDCGNSPRKLNNSTFERRNYKCSECDWTGKGRDLDKKRTPMTDNTVRAILRRTIERSDVEEIDVTPHKFGRKARALHRQASNWGEGSMRSFFGWAESSSAPGYYKEALEVNQKQDIAKEHPDLEVDIDGRFLDDTMTPSKCEKCDSLVSPLWDLCRRCGHEQTYQGIQRQGNEIDSKKNEVKAKTKDEVIDYLKQKSDVEDNELEELMVERLNQNMEEKGLI
jgi:integrase